jgi:hypothetical protein
MNPEPSTWRTKNIAWFPLPLPHLVAFAVVSNALRCRQTLHTLRLSIHQLAPVVESITIGADAAAALPAPAGAAVAAAAAALAAAPAAPTKPVGRLACFCCGCC